TLEMRGMLKGQPFTQYPQPMQFSFTKSTMPLEYCTIAPGDGHALRQPGSAQCMQPSLRISHSRLLVSGLTHSLKRISVQVAGVRSWGLSYTPVFAPTSSRRLFHSRQADWQALQPMHFEVSISFDTSVSCRAGGGTLEAERRIRSCGPNFCSPGWVDGFGSG